ncbi:MAG: uroporphyrinogen decarboxylase family protein [Armatimonadota bacterium]
MQDNMTSRERIIAAIEGKPVDHVPFCPFLAYVWEYFPAEVQSKGPLAFHHDTGADPLWRGAPCPVEQVIDGITVNSYNESDRLITETVTPAGTIRMTYRTSIDGGTAFLVEHPLKTEDDFKVQLWIEEHTKFRMANQAPVKEAVSLDGVAIGMLVPRAKTAFQTMIEHLVGTEELVYALYDFPETVEALLQTMVENDLKAARMSAESDYAYFLTWEDSSTQNYSPALYDKYIAPEIMAYCDILGANSKSYIQHACGHLKNLLPSMKNCGVKMVESLSPSPTGNIEIADARKILGAEVGIIGGIEPTKFLNLSMLELEGYVDQVIRDGSGGPFILANSDSCPPGVTVEKFKLAADVAKRTSV